jgi:hypothetical protein
LIVLPTSRRIQKFLEMKMVRERLKEFGLTPDEIQARLSQFDDQQVHQLALRLDDLKVGIYRSTGDPSGRFIWGNTGLVSILGYENLVDSREWP